MGKSGKSKKGSVARSTPYKKPTVSVTYDGDAKPTKPAKPVKTSKNTGPVKDSNTRKLNIKEKAEELQEKKEAKSKARSEEKAAKRTGDSKGKAKAMAELEAEFVEPEAPTGATFKIIAGSYEKLLYGLEGHYPSGSDVPVLKPIFIFPAHLSWIKCIAASPNGKYLATGSEDEFIKVWDLRRRREIGALSQHTGSITSVTFPTSQHLLATSVDATLSLFRTNDWALLKSLKGHSGRVNSVDVHPTGRVALSVGKDQTLKMWDLMRGRGAASLALGQEAEIVKFAPSGTHFAVLYPRKVEIYSLVSTTVEVQAEANLIDSEAAAHARDEEPLQRPAVHGDPAEGRGRRRRGGALHRYREGCRGDLLRRGCG